MSRGIGKTQRRILDELAASEHGNLFVAALARRIGLSDRQIRRAVHALADRELVALTKEPGGWAGVGEYGPLHRRDDGYWGEHGREEYGPEVPTADVRKKLIDDFDADGRPTYRRVDVEYVHGGMPTGVSLCVWLPEAHEERERRLVYSHARPLR